MLLMPLYNRHPPNRAVTPTPHVVSVTAHHGPDCNMHILTRRAATTYFRHTFSSPTTTFSAHVASIISTTLSGIGT